MNKIYFENTLIKLYEVFELDMPSYWFQILGDCVRIDAV